MSHLTDKARAPYRNEADGLPGPDSLEAIVAENPSRRSLLRGGLFGLSVLPAMALAAYATTTVIPPSRCRRPRPTPTPTPTPTPPPSYAVNFTSVAANQDDAVYRPAPAIPST